MCPQCEWNENNLNHIEINVFNNSVIQANINVDIGLDPIFHPRPQLVSHLLI